MASSGQLSTRATVALVLVISIVAVSSERSQRLVGAHVCGSRRDRCCRGWRASESRRCIIPVCADNCSPGGTCVKPNICRCGDGSLLTRCSPEPDPDTHPRLKRMADGTPHVKYTKKNSFEGPCSPTTCDHICENLPDNSYKCSCRQGYLMHANKRYCTLATFTGWTGDQHTGISAPTNSGQQQRDDGRGSGRVFGPPNAGGEAPHIWDVDSKDHRFKNGPYAFFPSPKPGVTSPEQKLKESYEPKDGKYTNDGQVDLEDQMWRAKQLPSSRAEGKGDEKSQNKEAVVRPDQAIWVKDLERVKAEELTGKRKQKDPVAEDVWETKKNPEKTKMEVPDIAGSQNSDSLYAKQWKHKTEHYSGESMAKLREDRKGAEDTDGAVQLKDEEKKYLEGIEWAKKELEKKENEKKEKEKKYNEKKENKKKDIEKKNEKENGKKENEKKENEKKGNKHKENKKKYIEKKLSDEREYGKKKYEKREHGKKVIGKGAHDDKARRRLVSLVESPKFHNYMPIREENAKKSPEFESDKEYPSFPVAPKAKSAGKNKAKKEGKAYPAIPNFLWAF
ncbi:unnamed protein product [Lymnaea stagnalis]|uniref:EGF-like domain-containing protein n=1 Tax=Lymnaea stagnalis TaxID=6523 RepID=A0AAV2HQU7_LYMST